MKYRTHTRRRRLTWKLIPSANEFELNLSDAEVLADLGFAKATAGAPRDRSVVTARQVPMRAAHTPVGPHPRQVLDLIA